MFETKFKQIFISIVIVLLLIPCFVLAAENGSPNLTNSAGFLNNAGESAGFNLGTTDVEPVLGKIIKTLLSFFGIVFFF